MKIIFLGSPTHHPAISSLTNNPVAMSVHIDEEMRLIGLLYLREDDVAVACHAVVLDVEHDLVVPRDSASQTNHHDQANNSTNITSHGRNLTVVLSWYSSSLRNRNILFNYN